MMTKLTRRGLDRRIMRDLVTGGVTIAIFAAAAYFLALPDMIAQCTGLLEFREIDSLVMVFLYVIWLVGIFMLRRLYELRQVLAQSQLVEEHLYEAQKMETLGQMARGMAHDLGNLLMVITGMSQDAATEEGGNDGSARADLLVVNEAGEEAVRLVDHFREFGRKGSDGKRAEVNLNKTLSHMNTMLKYLLGEKIKLVIRLHREAHPVRAALGQVEEVIVNLVVNAREAMPNGGEVTIETSNARLSDPGACARLALPPGDYVTLSVTDTGCGIHPTIKPRIFDRYFTTKERGSGLGLWVVRDVVSQYGGAIEAEGEPLKGATFRIYLPRDGVRAVPVADRPAKQHEHSPVYS